MLNKKNIIFGSVGFIIVLVMAWYVIAYSNQDFFSQHSIASKTLRINYTLSNTSGEFISNANFTVKIPMTVDSKQNLESISTSYKNEILQEGDGEQSVRFLIGNISPYSSKLVDLTLVIKVTDRPLYERVSAANYLGAEKYIELDSPAVKELAIQLKGSSAKETAKNIYEWLVNNVASSGYTVDSRGANYLIEKRSGDCTEFMYAFVALARANGLPARGVNGFWVATDSTIINAADYHDWAEFYDGESWSIVDPQKKIFAPNHLNYLPITNLSVSSQNSKRFSVSHDSISVSFSK